MYDFDLCQTSCYSSIVMLPVFGGDRLRPFLHVSDAADMNFVPKEKWKYPKAFIDRFRTYLFANDLAKAIKEVVDSKQKGLIHIVGDKKISMFELAKITCPDVQPMTLKEYSGPPLTVDMTLDTVKWKKYKISSL